MVRVIHPPEGKATFGACNSCNLKVERPYELHVGDVHNRHVTVLCGNCLDQLRTETGHPEKQILKMS